MYQVQSLSFFLYQISDSPTTFILLLPWIRPRIRHLFARSTRSRQVSHFFLFSHSSHLSLRLIPKEIMKRPRAFFFRSFFPILLGKQAQPSRTPQLGVNFLMKDVLRSSFLSNLRRERELLLRLNSAGDQDLPASPSYAFCLASAFIKSFLIHSWVDHKSLS